MHFLRIGQYFIKVCLWYISTSLRSKITGGSTLNLADGHYGHHYQLRIEKLLMEKNDNHFLFFWIERNHLSARKPFTGNLIEVQCVSMLQ